jgi:hypothetical protein
LNEALQGRNGSKTQPSGNNPAAPLDFSMVHMTGPAKARRQHMRMLNAEIIKRFSWPGKSIETPLEHQLARGHEPARNVGATAFDVQAIRSADAEANANSQRKAPPRPRSGKRRSAGAKQMPRQRPHSRKKTMRSATDLRGPQTFNPNQREPVINRSLRKLAPYYRPDTRSYRTDVPPVKIMHHLRKAYDEDLAQRLFPRWVACDFETSRLRRQPLYLGMDHEYVWRPVRFEPDPDTYSVYCTLVNRLEYLQDMFQHFRTTHPRLALQIALWQDTHHMLALHIEQTHTTVLSQALYKALHWPAAVNDTRIGVDDFLNVIATNLCTFHETAAEKAQENAICDAYGTDHSLRVSIETLRALEDTICCPDTCEHGRLDLDMAALHLTAVDEDTMPKLLSRVNAAMDAALESVNDLHLMGAHSQQDEFADAWTRLFERLEEHGVLDEMPDLDAPPASAYDLLRPSLRFVMHQGELPDLGFLVDRIGFFQDTQEASDGAPLDADLEQLLALLRKVPPNPHGARMFFSLCAISMIKYPRIWKCVSRMLFCSLAGLYEDTGAVAIAAFWVRHELYRHLVYEPGPPGDLVSWMHGFQYAEFRDDYERRNADKDNGQRGVSSRRLAGLSSKNTSLQFRWHANDPGVHVLDGSQITEMNPECFCGANDKQAKAGQLNMTDFLRLVFAEYIYLVIHLQQSLEPTLRSLYWFDDTFVAFVRGIDMCRNIVNTFFEPDVTDDDDVCTGPELLRRIAQLYTPCLRWDYVDNTTEVTQQPRGAFFQTKLLARGHVGSIVWNARVMALLEAVGYDIKKKVLPRSPRIMQQNFVDRTVHEMVRRDVNMANTVRALQKATEQGWRDVIEDIGSAAAQRLANGQTPQSLSHADICKIRDERVREAVHKRRYAHAHKDDWTTKYVKEHYDVKIKDARTNVALTETMVADLSKMFSDMQREERRLDDTHREFVERFVEYCLGRIQYGDFETWDDDLADTMRAFDRRFAAFMRSCQLDASLEQYMSRRIVKDIPVCGHGGDPNTYYPTFMALVPLLDLEIHPMYMLWLARYHYMHEIEQKSVERTLRLMLHYPREYVIVRWYFHCLRRCLRVRTYALPRFVTETQIRTWNHAMNLAQPGAPPPDTADRVYYCRYHGLKKPLVEDKAATQFHHGDVNVTLEPSTGAVYCRTQNPLLKKRHVQLPNGKKPEQRRVFDFYTSVTEMIMCSRIPLQTQHMFGRALQINDATYVMCPFCCAYTQLSTEKFCTPLGFGCNECAKIFRAKYDAAHTETYKFFCSGCTRFKLHQAKDVHRLVVWDDTCRILPHPYWRRIYLCSSHNHPTIRTHPQLLSLHYMEMFWAQMLWKYTFSKADVANDDGSNDDSDEYGLGTRVSETSPNSIWVPRQDPDMWKIHRQAQNLQKAVHDMHDM